MLTKEEMLTEALIKVLQEVKGYEFYTKNNPVIAETLLYADQALEKVGWGYQAPVNGFGLPKYRKIDAQTPNTTSN